MTRIQVVKKIVNKSLAAKNNNVAALNRVASLSKANSQGSGGDSFNPYQISSLQAELGFATNAAFGHFGTNQMQPVIIHTNSNMLGQQHARRDIELAFKNGSQANMYGENPSGAAKNNGNPLINGKGAAGQQVNNNNNNNMNDAGAAGNGLAIASNKP